MADRSMKAVIRAEVDPSGVVRGVNTATRELERLNQTSRRISIAAGVSAAIEASRVMVNMASRAANFANTRANDIVEMVTQNNVAAANAATLAFGDRVMAQRRAAQALAPGVISGIQAQSAAELSGLNRLAMTPGMGEAVGNFMRGQAVTTEARNAAADAVTFGIGEIVGLLRGISEKLGRPF